MNIPGNDAEKPDISKAAINKIIHKKLYMKNQFALGYP